MRIHVARTAELLMALIVACSTRDSTVVADQSVAKSRNDSTIGNGEGVGLTGVSDSTTIGSGKATLRSSAGDSTRPRSSSASPAVASDSIAKAGVVHTDMQHVNMHIEPGIVLAIERLRGKVLPTRKDSPPALNDKSSMIIDIESGEIAIDTLSLATLLNRHVFGYAKSPLRKLHVSVEGNEMVQTGQMKKLVWLSFRIRATVTLTGDGDIRVHPTAIKVAGIGVKSLSDKLGGLSKLVKLEPGHGAKIDGDDFILSPTEMLPPPRIRGKLTSIKLEPGGLRQTFGSGEAAHVALTHRPGSIAKNYMYFHGGTLRFGKLTMAGTDLEIVDMDQSNPFDYALDRYQEHLVAGHSNTTPVDGLIVVMPDVQKLPPTPVKK